MSFSYSPLALYSVLSWVHLQYISCISSRTCQSTPSQPTPSDARHHVSSTNQTTLESLSSFLLLIYLPPLPLTLRLSDPPLEHELSYNQRQLVRKVHSAVKLYDLGWQRNWAQVFGWSRTEMMDTLHSLWWRKVCSFSYSFPSESQTFVCIQPGKWRKPHAEDMLSKPTDALATDA